MSLARTALRLAAIAALEADPVIAALCPNRVYDSRIDKLDGEGAVPVILVFTEDDKGHAFNPQNGGPPFDHDCELLIEISMRVVVGGNGDDIVIGMAETDAEAEMTIDLLEEVAVNAVTVANTPQAALIRKAVLRRVTEFKSIRFASAESGSKLALRAVSLAAHLKIDEPDAREVPTGPFVALPDPLRTVAASLDPASPGYATCVAIATRLTAPAAPQVLDGLDFGLYPTDLSNGQRTEALWRTDSPGGPYPDPYSADPVPASTDLP